MKLQSSEQVDALLIKRIHEWHPTFIPANLNYAAAKVLLQEFKAWMKCRYLREYQAVSRFDKSKSDGFFCTDSFGVALFLVSILDDEDNLYED